MARASCSTAGDKEGELSGACSAFLFVPPAQRWPCPPETQSQHGAVSLQVTRGLHTYSVGVCTEAAGLDEGGCKDGAVCLLSGTKGASFGRLASMKLDYRHQDEAVILSYANGDTCPPGKSSRVECLFPVDRELDTAAGGK